MRRRLVLIAVIAISLMSVGVAMAANGAITQNLYADGDIGCDGTTEVDQRVGRVIIKGTDYGIRYHVVFTHAAPNEEYQITLNGESGGCVSELQRNFGFTTNANGNGVFRGMYPADPGVYQININVVSDDGVVADPAHRELGTNGFVEVMVP